MTSNDLIMVPGVWEIFRADCTVILRYCKSKSGRKCKSYCTLKHQRILNLQFAQFFKGLKRGLLTKIRCSLCLQGMVLDGLKGFQAKKSKSMTFNYKSCISYLVLALLSSIFLRHMTELWHGSHVKFAFSFLWNWYCTVSTFLCF